MKRIIDFVVATFILVIVSTPMIILMLICFILNGRPIFFKQARPGLHGKPFMLVKFRTMSNKLGPDSKLLSDKDRLTLFGKFLRHTSLDELPELWNVIAGNMSLVGPRPLLMEYLPLYSKEQLRRHEVRPGITGWAQINGRNTLSWEDKFKLDVWYVDNHTLILDLKILLLTIVKVIKREGIMAENDASMPLFKGCNINE